MSGHVQNVLQSWDKDAKPDSMIVGRKSGPLLATSTEPTDAPFTGQKSPPCNFSK
jgi:hypothetical protein